MVIDMKGVSDPSIRFRKVKTTEMESAVYRTFLNPLGKYIWVYVPSGYHSLDTKNKTLYMFDGQNIFDLNISQYNSWKAGIQLDSFDNRNIVVVGIQSNETRDDDYSLHKNAAKTIKLIINHIIPVIEKRITGHQTAKQRIIGGSSLGACAAMAALKHSATFSNFLLFSPAVEDRYKNQLKFLSTIKEDKNRRVYIDIGTREASSQGYRNINDVEFVLRSQAIYNSILSKSKKSNIEFLIDECNPCHNEEAWHSRFTDALFWALSSASGGKDYHAEEEI